MTATGGWVIDRDYINGGEGDSVPSRVGVSRGTVDPKDRVRFRLLDDDGEVYYGGWLTEAEDGESAGSSLWDFGARDGGTTDLQVRNAAGAWESYIG